MPRSLDGAEAYIGQQAKLAWMVPCSYSRPSAPSLNGRTAIEFEWEDGSNFLRKLTAQIPVMHCVHHWWWQPIKRCKYWAGDMRCPLLPEPCHWVAASCDCMSSNVIQAWNVYCMQQDLLPCCGPTWWWSHAQSRWMPIAWDKVHVCAHTVVMNIMIQVVVSIVRHATILLDCGKLFQAAISEAVRAVSDCADQTRRLRVFTLWCQSWLFQKSQSRVRDIPLHYRSPCADTLGCTVDLTLALPT